MSNSGPKENYWKRIQTVNKSIDKIIKQENTIRLLDENFMPSTDMEQKNQIKERQFVNQEYDSLFETKNS